MPVVFEDPLLVGYSYIVGPQCVIPWQKPIRRASDVPNSKSFGLRVQLRYPA